MISRYRTCISTYLLGISDCFLAGLSIGQSLIFQGEFPVEQGKIPEFGAHIMLSDFVIIDFLKDHGPLLSGAIS
jgi:hypothetical protein